MSEVNLDFRCTFTCDIVSLWFFFIFFYLPDDSNSMHNHFANHGINWLKYSFNVSVFVHLKFRLMSSSSEKNKFDD